MDEQGKVIDVLPVYMFNMQREGKQGVLENRIESEIILNIAMKSQDKLMKYAVSACLMGINCKYDGGIMSI